ncbi:MAG: histone family protein DNA-binding protein [Bacteroidetes bacterium]|nr:histone family protein DNA-binding protein [Bacteroidota bacterium]
MNNKELIAYVAMKMNLPKAEVKYMLDAFAETCTEQLKQDNSIEFQSFGTIEVQKIEERQSVHPVTKIRTLMPPELVVIFKQSSILKEKLNSQL